MRITAESFPSLHADTRRIVRSFASRYVGRDRADDAAQETYLRVWAARDTFIGETRDDLRKWMLSITANTCRDMLRRSAIRRADSIDSATETGDSLASLLPGGEGVASEATDAIRRLNEILSTLPPESAEVLRLFMSGRSEADIAGILGIPAGTVKSRLFKARQRVRDAWEG
jgi:RNA polymerase sigma-70 factor (ECF subfamily)